MASTQPTTYRAVADKRGTFVQGVTASVLLKITDFEGNPVNAESITVTIVDALDVEVIAATAPTFASDGFYVHDWDIDSDQDVGDYTVQWDYVVDGEAQVEEYEITVADAGSDAIAYSGRLYDMRLALEKYLCCAQSIPVYYEEARPTSNKQKFNFTFPRWNQSAGVRIFRNGQLLTSGLTVNHFTGAIQFDEMQTPFDRVNADYNFRWFSDEQLDNFLLNAIQLYNSYPPHTSEGVLRLPNRFIPSVLYAAAADALREMIMCLQFQEPQEVFGGPDRAGKAADTFESLKQNYEKIFLEVFNNKIKFPYVGLTRLVVTPSFTLPGGRCISLKDKGLCIIDNDIVELEMDSIFDLFNAGSDISLLSQYDETGDSVFAPIGHIWRTGKKTIISVETENGYKVDSSDEHLFYVNGSYLPAFKIQTGDYLTCFNGKSIEAQKVKFINRRRVKTEMLDIEMPLTSNFFANGIKCHNSRWFRYLFSGSGSSG